ncbi:ABC transporter substrate-binding protein [Azohydromonas sp. G-1-1-14]|uniref:ABC transporter substrate-binding protein n=2 Tax=Azohydromonas caseinilytica TaxID=2728836 RepID=A0A848F208_9BURK|nr:ABC transporter substrate-binding protein [Azohydromonas caseinilytica]NML13442.1 ABC transporter substrate-binding protein [Azohydromonas caseinilytica]
MLAGPLHAQSAAAPDAFVRQLSDEVLDALKNDKAVQGGDVARIRTLVDAKVLPHVNFQRMTAAVVGRSWRTATPEQKQRLQEEFKTLLVRTYAGALTQVKNQSVALKPFRGNAADQEVVVRSEVRGGSEPIQLDYRLEKAGDAWKIYDVNVAGVWMVDQYKNSFAQEIASGGLDGLISKLAERNKSGGKG